MFVGGLVISWALIVAYFAASLIDAFSDEPASTWWQLTLQTSWFWLGLVVATIGEILVYWGASRGRAAAAVASRPPAVAIE